MSFKVPEKFRIQHGKYATNKSDGNNGAFQIKSLKIPPAFVIASDGFGWEHVSVSLPTQRRTPTWEEMCVIKNFFWDEDDCVVQFHPPKSQYVNNHPGCLHLWRPTEQSFPMPASIMVGIKNQKPEDG